MDLWLEKQTWIFNLSLINIKLLPVCAYLSKSEDECSLAMTQAVRDAFEKELDNHEQMKSVANVYLNKRECSVQECVYHILPGQWLRKTFPGVIFANSNIPEKRFRIFLSENKISDLPEDSKNLFNRSTRYDLFWWKIFASQFFLLCRVFKILLSST